MSAFDFFSNSEVKKDDDNMIYSFTQTRSKTVKQRIATTVYEEECESGDEDSLNNRGSDLAEDGASSLIK